MKTKLLLALIPLALTTGCLKSSMAQLMSAIGNDPATVHIQVRTIYGTIDITRANPQTNSMPYTISPDGTIQVGK